jgi:hypothetical protein
MAAENTKEIVPFFEDTRTLTEKLYSDEKSWAPAKDKACPKEIYVLILERGSYLGAYGDEPHPTARGLDADGTVWSIIGFHGWLESELKRKNPLPGDFAAFAYRGTKPATKPGESDAHVYKVEVVRNPNAAAQAESADQNGGGSATESVATDDVAATDDGIPF